MSANMKWPDPTPEMLNDPMFNKIWNVIKTWDINVPTAYSGYCGATGNHARAIYDALLSASPSVLDAGLPAYVPPNHPWPSAADMPTAYESVDSISSGGTAPIPDAARIAIKDEAREEAAKLCERRAAERSSPNEALALDWTARHIRETIGQP